jgi:hypothetical protein
MISEAWNVQVYRHIPTPKLAYVADWENLPAGKVNEWQNVLPCRPQIDSTTF